MFYQDVMSKMLMTNSDDRNYAWKLCTSIKQSSYHRDLSNGVKSTFLTFSSQFPTNSVNLTKFLPFLYMRNIEYLRGTLSSHENYHIPTMRNGKTTEILSSLLWDSHKILWGIFVRDMSPVNFPHKGPVMRKKFPCMSWCHLFLRWSLP